MCGESCEVIYHHSVSCTVFLSCTDIGARNEQVVTISYFVAQGEFRLPIVLAVVFLAGFLISWIFAMYHIAKLKLALRTANKKNLNLENKITDSTLVQEVDA